MLCHARHLCQADGPVDLWDSPPRDPRPTPCDPHGTPMAPPWHPHGTPTGPPRDPLAGTYANLTDLWDTDGPADSSLISGGAYEEAIFRERGARQTRLI